MTYEKNVVSGNTTMLILKLLEGQDMYGYQIIDEILKKSGNTFNLKTGTLYPIMHGLEKDGMVTSYDETAESGRARKYYRLTNKGKALLLKKESEWKLYVNAVNRLMSGGEVNAFG
ncbi:MAG: PadR family transcriptional regulator [Oscillospiraceae bacterium]|nr:PadR family transcriptional regulator [Oscillospiraceae bacterium]